MYDLIIIGANGHGKVIADIAEKNGYSNIAFLDDNSDIFICGEYNIIGKCSDAVKYKSSEFIVGIGNTNSRRKIQKLLTQSNLNVVSLFHPAAVISKTARIGNGTVVMAGAVINPYVKIGSGCIINTCASVDHDCVIGDYVHISVGAHVAGTVKIGDNTWIGAGATVSNNIEITNDCTIGAGATVVCDIENSGTYIGIPAKNISRI